MMLFSKDRQGVEVRLGNEPLFDILDGLHKSGASGHKVHRGIFRTERYRCQNFPSLSHNTLTSAEEYKQ
jgi:hypothetical protein